MKKIMLAALGIVYTISFTSCRKDNINGEGPVVSQARVTGVYNGIGLAINATVYYTEAADYSLEIKAQQNIINAIQTEIDGDKLIIKTPAGTNFYSYEPINIYIKSPDADKFALSGSGNIIIQQVLHASFADFDISGSGKILVDTIAASDIDTRISGSGSLLINNGNTVSEKIDISGSGMAELSNVFAKECTTQTSGSGVCRVNVSDKLNVQISGSGNVFYKGNPTIVSHISGSGKVIKL